MNERNAIGVVGGLGPYAGLDLVQKLFDETIASVDQDHLPVVLISFPGQVPDRSTYIEDQSKPDPVPALAEILRRLEGAGCAIAGMPCNTAHAPVIFDVLNEAMERENRGIRLLNMIDASAAAALELDRTVSRVGVLATTSTLRTALYATSLACVGLQIVEPDEGFQDRVVNPVIFNEDWGIKARSNPPTERARESLLEGIRHLRDRGAEAVILGCTELPLAVPEAFFEDIPLIDSTRSLARALIDATWPQKLRQAPALRSEAA